ncbi:MAG: hypothetical protein H0W65_00455 [Sphingomonas sp.]|uniref:hypothetical protein n=1 Tax=Sphingomonas sp. TaxID=28214 RepID=UPI0018205589|nr:hypothetical protein [Sphingomonas sp.]MBA3666181.1 hypothetical protein [Sphingomonas sp.]
MIWGDLLTENLLFGAASALIAGMTAAFLDWWRPAMPARRIAVISGFVLPFLLLVLVIVGTIFFLSDDCPPEDVCDAGAMAFAGLMMIGAWAICVALIFGLMAGHLAIKYLRRS